MRLNSLFTVLINLHDEVIHLENLDFSIIYSSLPDFLIGSWITIKISIISMILGTLIGFIVGVIRASGSRRIPIFLASIYLEIFRGTPLLIQLFFIYFGLPTIGISLSPLSASIIGLALNSGAYISEIVRAGIIGVDKGQWEAADALGLNHLQSILYIVLPQATRIILPPLVNAFSSLLKDSSLVSILSIVELSRVGQLIYTKTFQPFEVYTTVGLLYLVMTSLISYLSHLLEKKKAIY